MPSSPGPDLPSVRDPDSLWAFCLNQVQRTQGTSPALTSLDSYHLLWAVTVSLSHASELASRIFASARSFEVPLLVQVVARMLQNPTPVSLWLLWHTWRTQNPDLCEVDSLEVPAYFMICQMRSVDCRWEIAKRGRNAHLPVTKAWAGLTAGPFQPDRARQQRFMKAMDSTLKNTVNRRLHHAGNTSNDLDISAIGDAENVALLAAVERERRASMGIATLFLRGGSITTNAGESIKIPVIPQLPVTGMERADGPDAVWRTAAQEMAFKVLAKLSPIVGGNLETALPDAAHAAQRAEHDRAQAKMRGDSGGRKAKKRGTAEPQAVHVPLGDPDAHVGGIDPNDLPDHGLGPLEQLEEHEDWLRNHQEAARIMRIAIDRWGASGQKMVKALEAGMSDRQAAKAAGISAPAMSKRRKVLENLAQR